MSELTTKQDLTSIRYCQHGVFTAETLSKALTEIIAETGKDLAIFVEAIDPDQPICRIRYMRGPKGDIVGLELVAE